MPRVRELLMETVKLSDEYRTDSPADPLPPEWVTVQAIISNFWLGDAYEQV